MRICKWPARCNVNALGKDVRVLGDLSEQFTTSTAILPNDFALGKLAGKVVNDNHMTLGYCNLVSADHNHMSF